MGLTKTGYVRRSYHDILNDKIQRAKELFGEDIDTSDFTPLGKFIRINAYDQAIAEEEIEAVYYARFPNTASGNSLDRLLVFGGMSRNPATAASYTVAVQGTPEYVIEAGFLVGTETDLTFYSTQDVTIGEDGTCTIEVSCTEPGIIGNVHPSAINQVVNPDANIDAVLGKEYIAHGVDEESDADVRTRLKATFASSGSGNENAIRAAILRIPTVQFATVVVNDGETTDDDGRPPHSFECYVIGGEDYQQEIAEAIFSKRPVGIKTYGNKTVQITDASGNERDVCFSDAMTGEIEIGMYLATNTSFPADGTAQLQKSIRNYINGLGIGTPLVLSKLFSHIYSVPGVDAVYDLAAFANNVRFDSDEVIDIPQYGITKCDVIYVEGARDLYFVNDEYEQISVAVGETVNFSVEAIGTDLSYQWKYAVDRTVSLHSEFITPDGDEYKSSTLSFVVAEDSPTVWMCEVTDAYGGVAWSRGRYIEITEATA